MQWKSWAGIGVGLLSAALLWKGYRNTEALQVTDETVLLPDLPPAFEGFRILQLSDLHLRRQSSRGRQVLDLVETIDPDLVCLTGDYEFTSISLPDVDMFLQTLASRRTAVGVLGNADHRIGISEEDRARWGRFLPFLNNRALRLPLGDAALWIAGVDDPHTGYDRLPSAMAEVPDGAPTILLAHSPEIILRPLDPRIRLILCGHTHGGQICLPDGTAIYHNSPLPRQFSSGRHQLNGATLYVSRGIGSTRLPLRFGCLPEITVFTLMRASSEV